MSQIFVCLLNSENIDFVYCLFLRPGGTLVVVGGSVVMPTWPDRRMNGEQFYAILGSIPHPSTLPFKSFVNIPSFPLPQQRLEVGSLEEAREWKGGMTSGARNPQSTCGGVRSVPV